MDLTWTHENAPVWDDDKQRVIGGAPEGAFVIPFKDGQSLPGDWWSAQRPDGTVVGYGRLDTTWGGDAEILLAVDPALQQQGAGSYILARLEDEAAARGINYIHNTIRDHEERDLVHDWLVVRGFRGPSDSVLRKRVGAGSAPAGPRRPGTAKVAERYDAAADPGSRPPGHEETGGYVNVDDHQY
ncbi:MAG: GNAT family N-acetyltransferase [Nocardioidaceae bacterium]